MASTDPRPIPFAALAEHIGRAATSDWHLIDQDRIDRFADATDDHQWIHVDVERATRETGGTIAHGYLLLSLLPFLSRGLMDVSGVTRRINYGVEQVRFLTPVRAGARVRLVQTLAGVTPRGGGQQLRLASTLEMEGADKPALVAETLVLAIPE